MAILFLFTQLRAFIHRAYFAVRTTSYICAHSYIFDQSFYSQIEIVDYYSIIPHYIYIKIRKNRQVGPALTKELAHGREYCTLRFSRAAHTPLQRHNGVLRAYPERAAQGRHANKNTTHRHTRTHTHTHTHTHTTNTHTNTRTNTQRRK